MDPYVQLNKSEGPLYVAPDGSSSITPATYMPKYQFTHMSFRELEKIVADTIDSETKGQARIWERRDIDTCPRIMRMPNPAELCENTTAERLELFLWFTQASLEYHPDGKAGGLSELWHPMALAPVEFRRVRDGTVTDGVASTFHLFPKPIAFANKKEKRQCNEPKWKTFETFQYFLSALDPRYHTRVGFFCSESDELVATEASTAWAAVLGPLDASNPEQGSRLIIYDPKESAKQREDRTHYENLPQPLQLRLVDYISTKEKRRIGELWLAGDDEATVAEATTDEERTGRWVQNLLQTWPLWPFSREMLKNEKSEMKELDLGPSSTGTLGIEAPMQIKREILSEEYMDPSDNNGVGGTKDEA
jgi:hypothetical protein